MSERSNLTGGLVVRLTDLPIQRKLSLGPAFVEKAIGDLAMRAALERPPGDESIGEASATVDLYEGSPGVFVRGSLSGNLVVACSRCIEPVQVAVDEQVAVSYLPASEVPDDDDGLDESDDEVTADDVDLYPYEGEEIDLSRLFHERLILAVPYAPLCGEDCKGLCAVCGANLNEADCGCDRHVVDPRLAALRNIKLSGTSSK